MIPIKRLIIFILLILSENILAQTFFSDPFAHTYSIVARDPETGEMGVAVQSHWFSVGSVVSWAEAGVGAIATQSLVEEDGRDVRQLAVVDAKGGVATHTGKRCIPEAGHFTGDNFSVQANMMLKNSVWDAMAKAFQASKGPLAERMVAALEAAQAEGGDIRGKQSASILVVRGESTGKLWEDRVIDLRVEDHPEAVQEIKRVLRVFRAYEYMNKGDLALEHNDVDGALENYSAAEEMFPDNLEMKYWHAVSLANIGMIQESLPIFHEVFQKDKNWRILTQRLPGVDLLNVEEKDLKEILNQ